MTLRTRRLTYFAATTDLQGMDPTGRECTSNETSCTMASQDDNALLSGEMRCDRPILSVVPESYRRGHRSKDRAFNFVDGLAVFGEGALEQ
jgi:hypothetical protein